MTDKKNSYFSTTLEKGMKIMALFNQDRISCSLTEISKLTGINMTSTYRFVNTLVELGYLRRDTDSKQLKLGPKSLALGHGFIRGFDLLQMVRPIIDDCFERLGTTVDAGMLDGDTLLLIYRREAGNTLTYRLPMVTRSFHCSCLGKSVLAFLPEDQARGIFERQANESTTITRVRDWEELVTELRQIKARGYAINNEEYIPGLIAVGAPLFNLDTNQVVGAISFDLSTATMTVDQMEERYAGAIQQLAAQVSEVMPIFQ